MASKQKQEQQKFRNLFLDPTPQHVIDKLDKLFSNYKDGWAVLKNAPSWDSPIEKVENADDNAPEDWTLLMGEVCETLAREKHGLDLYDNDYEIIDIERMLDAHANIGLPIMYSHWSFGKRREEIDREFKSGRMGLALEMIINSDPTKCYLMANNPKAKQAAVIAHAGAGHNFVFKNNFMFKDFTEADNIHTALRQTAKAVSKARQTYGDKRVDKLLDACHALKDHGVDRFISPTGITDEERKAQEERVREFERKNYDPAIAETAGTPSEKTRKQKQKKNKNPHELARKEENIMRFVGQNAPHMEDWERDIMEKISYIAQYFEPQAQTIMVHESAATTMHYLLSHELEQLGIIDSGMMQEILHLHSDVIAQPAYTHYPGINHYALGFYIAEDLVRICKEPTEEDYYWFPNYAGREDWQNVLMEAWSNYDNAMFVHQFLSPKVIRDMKLFTLKDDDREDEYEITAIHNERGYKHIRHQLAKQFRPSEQTPYIVAAEYDYRGDRSLTLHHYQNNRMSLNEKDTKRTLKHLYYLWQHPIHLESFDEDGNLSTTLSFPEETTSRPHATPKKNSSATPMPSP